MILKLNGWLSWTLRQSLFFFACAVSVPFLAPHCPPSLSPSTLHTYYSHCNSLKVPWISRTFFLTSYFTWMKSIQPSGHKLDVSFWGGLLSRLQVWTSCLSLVLLVLCSFPQNHSHCTLQWPIAGCRVLESQERCSLYCYIPSGSQQTFQKQSVPGWANP